MTVIRIDSFGGEYPSLSGQALPGDGAQRNVNLYAGIKEFRPLMEDKAVVGAPPGAKSIYRTQRKDANSYNGLTNEAENWLISAKELSYVKGQVNDDATERTYFTTDDGSDFPKAFDLSSVNGPRKLGVPPPTTVVTAIVEGKSFTIDDTDEALNAIAKQLREAIIECTIIPGDTMGQDPSTAAQRQKASRYKDYTPNPLSLVPLSGPKSHYGLAPTEGVTYALPASWHDMHWKLHAVRPADELIPVFGEQGLARLGWVFSTAGTGRDRGLVSLDALPFSLVPDRKDPANPGKYLLEGKLRAFKNPKDDSALFDDAEVANMIRVIIEDVRPQVVVPDLLNKMDECVKTFATLVFGSSPSAARPTLDRPVAPTGPKTVMVGTVSLAAPEWSMYNGALGQYNKDVSAGSAGQLVKPSEPAGPQYLVIEVTLPGEIPVIKKETVESPEWVFYRGALQQYHKDLEAWNKSAPAGESQKVLTDRVAALQAEAMSLSAQIESRAIEIFKKHIDEKHLKTALIGGFGGEPEIFNGLDARRVKEARFYVATHVTDWGEESAPSAVSEMLEPTQYDTVDVTLTDPPAGRHIQKIRLYRSNAGSVSSVFQFVAELDAKAQTYNDALKAAQLGEGLATTTWLEPPEKLRGLVGMPNGIMAGFFDNTVCFCDPYHPYAWPVEYQITTEHPIVGLAAFGQTLFVGTTGSPYFLSGSDSASMSALKMESNQACTSRRSIVAVQGGVLFASPDGLCSADQRGVSVLTQGIFTREDWQKLDPSTMMGAEHEGIYYLFYKGNGGGVFSLDMVNKKLTRLEGVDATALFVDRFNDALYYAQPSSGKIMRLYGGDKHRSGRWKSGRNPMAQHVTLAWAQIEGFPTEQEPVILRLYGDNYFVDFRGDVYEVTADFKWRRRRDGVVFTPGSAEHNAIHYTLKFTDCLPQRLPFGRWRDHEIEIESRSRVTRVTLAGSTEELKGV